MISVDVFCLQLYIGKYEYLNVTVSNTFYAISMHVRNI